MIKLKQLILESWATWTSPSNVPNEVIRVYHALVASILKQGKNPHEWSKLTKEQDYSNIGGKKVPFDGWYIHHKNGETFLMYDKSINDTPSNQKPNPAIEDLINFLTQQNTGEEWKDKKDQQMPFKILKNQSSWVFVENEEEGGWILEKSELLDVIKNWTNY